MKSIGKYQVIEELGGSATGRTYRVRDAFRNREFAVKILQTVPNLSAESKEQFCGHLAACAELTHRHIAKINDLGEVDDGIFVATEWRSGMDLRRFMQQNQDLPLGQKLAVMAQVAEGLAFAHSRGIAHGNLKPSNIFVDAARDVSILDFGIAKWLAALLDAGSRPQALVANYLAPEQVLGQSFDARSDIFALGLMLYEFASGKYPFSADPGVIAREIVHSEPAPLRQLDAQVPEELEQLLARALKKDPEQRLQTAEEFASGLYLAAQQLRRAASTPVLLTPAAEPAAAVESSSSEPIPNPVPPVLAAQPFIPQPAPATAFETPALQEVARQEAARQEVALPQVAPEQVALEQVAPQDAPALQVPVAAPRVRERPQDAEPPPRPWSARSYAASGPPSANAIPPKQPAAPASLYHPPTPPSYQPPQSFLQPAAPLPEPVAPKASRMTKSVLIAVAGLILAAGIVGSLISRQNLRASQNRSHTADVETKAIVPVKQPPAPPAAVLPEARAPKPGESGPDDLGNPEFSAKQTLNGPVRSLWESGRYGPALALVDQVLANNPTNEDARGWRKKIRAAQAAEAALK
ncbi:MAG: protein kinase [Bryobacteraceae bacterium]|jgi:serine/threonine-protein kinase